MNGSVLYDGNTLLSGAINVNTGGNIEPLNVSITENGNQTINAPVGVNGYNPITIETNVPSVEPILDDITITENGTYTPPTGTDGYDEIVVNVPPITPVLDDITITENGTYTPPTGTDGYDEIIVNVSAPANALFIKKYEGVPTSIASFNDGTSNPLKSLTASIVPVQAGSGDPSPTNVRPISGWTEEVITRTRKNLIDVSLLGLYDVTGNNTRRVGIPITLKAGTYTISKDSGSIPLYLTNKTNNYSTTEIDAYPFTFTIENDSELYIRSAVTDINQWNYTNLQVELGSTATTYEPYAGTTTTIPFTDSQGQSVKVFGGSVDVVNGGEQPRTLGSVDLGELEWGYDANIRCWNITIQAEWNMKGVSNNQQVANATAEQFKLRKASGMSSSVAGELAVDVSMLRANTGSDNEAPKGLLIYELATPTTFNTQPTAVKSLDGENNMSASTGDVEELKYFTRTTQDG